jgi:hypothetical protein
MIIWSLAPAGCTIPEQTGQLTAGRKVTSSSTLTLVIIHRGQNLLSKKSV